MTASEMRDPGPEELSVKITIKTGAGRKSLTYAAAIALVNRLTAKGRLQRAGFIAAQLVEMFPMHSAPKVLLLYVSVQQRDYARMLELADEIAPFAMQSSETVALCVRAYRQAGRGERARELSLEAGEAFPDDALVQNEIGLCLLAGGDRDGAVAAFNRAISANPYFVPPYMARARLTAGQLGGKEIRAMEKIAAEAKMLDENRAILDFAIAWAYEGIDADKHFDYLHRANAIIARLRPWDAAGEQERVAQTKQFFSPRFFQLNKDCRISDIAPIFVVGMPRSGTSLVEQILAAHDQVTGCGETGGIDQAVNAAALHNHRRGPVWNWAKPDEFGQFLPAIDHVYRHRLVPFDIQTPRFVDKSLGLEWWCGLILAMYPNARIVHCLRHPLDSCLSMYQIHFGQGQAFAYNLESIARYYLCHMELMDHWKALFPRKIQTVRYEDLVTEQRAHTARLLEFAELPWQDECLSFERVDRAARTASDYQIKQPLYSSSVGRWKRYAKYLEEPARILSIDVSQAADGGR